MHSRTKKKFYGVNERHQAVWLVVLAAVMFVSIVFPLFQLFRKAFIDSKTLEVGFSNFITYFQTPSLSHSIINTLNVSLWTTVISVVLAFIFAYATSRTGMVAKPFFKYIVMLPLFTPTMMHGIGLTYLFGNQGLFTTGFFGWLPFSFDIHLYGPVGIIIAEVIYTFPQAFLILSLALAVTDYRLYEAADTMGVGKIKQFLHITLPSVKFGIISTCFVCFTLSFTDFGAPKVVGGQYNVLATDIFKQVIGQQNMSMGAVVGLILTIPSICSFIVDRIISRKQQSTFTAKSTVYVIKKNSKRDVGFTLYCSCISGCILLLFGAVGFASLVKIWPYNLSLTFDHYRFSNVAGAGLNPFLNSVTMSFFTAIIGTAVIFFIAYMSEKIRLFAPLRQLLYFLAMIPLALPGIVVGLAFIFFFNLPNNPLHFIYNTMTILVLANIVHFFSVSFLSATTALKQLDKEMEQASESMNVSFYKTFFRITVPMCMPAITGMMVYLFVNSMVTVSALVFLYGADLKPASVAIVNMEDAGDVAEAAAMSMLILLLNLGVKGCYEAVVAFVTKHRSKRREKVRMKANSLYSIKESGGVDAHV
jgi:iron(III) transport system permease protein